MTTVLGHLCAWWISLSVGGLKGFGFGFGTEKITELEDFIKLF